MAKSNIDVNGVDKLPKRLREKFNKEAQRIIDNSIKEILYQTEKKYEEVIQDFYDDYSPHIYNRTEATFEASSGYHNLYSSKNIEPIKGGYKVGINVSSDNIPENPYEADKDWVFERTFGKGIHGYTRAELVDFRNKAKAKAQKEGRNFVYPWKFIDGEQDPLKPPPKQRMDEWWNDFKKNTVPKIMNNNSNK